MLQIKVIRRRSRRAILLALTVAVGLLAFLAEAGARGHFLQALGLSKTEQGREAPEFTLADSAGTVHRLRDYRGRVVLLSFGATW